MDINLLVLNVGNSRLAVGAFVAGELVHVDRIPHAEKERWPDAIKDAWSKIADLDDPSVAGASVNPAVMEAIEHVVGQQVGTKVEWVGRDLDLPSKVLTDPPAET